MDVDIARFARLAQNAAIVSDFDADVGKGFADAIAAGAEFVGGEGGDLGGGFSHAVG